MYQSSKLPVGNLRGTFANIDVTFQVYDIFLLLHLSIELILVYVHKSTTFCQSLIIVYVVLHTDRYIRGHAKEVSIQVGAYIETSLVTLTVGLRQLTGEATRRCGRAPDSSLPTSLFLTADVLKRAVSSF